MGNLDLPINFTSLNSYLASLASKAGHDLLSGLGNVSILSNSWMEGVKFMGK